MKTIFNYKRLVSVLAMFLAIGCSDDFLDINENPNNPQNASIDLLLSSAQVSSGFQTSRVAMENASIFIQHFYNLAESTYAIDGNLTDNDFNGIYSQALKDYRQVIATAEEDGLPGYAGVSKVMSAYLFSFLTDLWGEVPFSDALQGETILGPEFDSGQEIYDGLLVLLDDAIADLNAANDNEELVTGDLIYGGDFEQWIRAANTLKLKLFLNLRTVDATRATNGIQALIDEDMLIDDNADDFQFEYAENVAPLNQHPVYQQEYVAGNKGFYMNNYFMYNMLSKGDPRIRYYVYRQGTNAELDFQTTPCAQRQDCEYWPLLQAMPAADGYIGREHGDPSGIPGDNTIRATFGVYPIGGSYDNNARNERVLTSGTGAGIVPWLTNSMRAFMLAEAALELGTTGDPRALMEEGIRASMAKVVAFGAAKDPNAPAATLVQPAINTYVNNILGDYDDATTDAQRLDVIIKEKYYANFGNGIESYNDFRRTGFPSDLPQSLAPSGPFPLRFPLGPTELNSNPNAPDPAPLVSQPVFWDNN